MNIEVVKDDVVNMNDVDNASTILIIDDDEDVRDSLKDVIEVELPEYKVVVAENAKQAVALARQHAVSIALIDIKLGRTSGLELVQPIKSINEHIACIMITAFREAEYAVEAVQKGADDYLFKPIEPTKLFKTITRFQKRFELERDKREAEKRFKAVFEQNFQMVFLLDFRGDVIDVNQTALDSMHERKRDVLGKSFSQLPWWGNFEGPQHMLDSALSQVHQGKVFRGEMQSRAGDPSPMYYVINLKPVSVDRKEFVTVVECRDITSQRTMENRLLEAKALLEERVRERTKELQSAKEYAEKANAAKTHFLSQISHELRTPLNAILGFTQLLNMDESAQTLTAEQVDYLSEIDVAGTRLLELIDALLTLTQIESGRFFLRSEPVDVKNVLDGAIAKLSPKALARQISIQRLGPDLDTSVVADSKYLGDVISDLMLNAIEYNKANGEIRIHANKSDDGNRLVIAIEDTGIGIPDQVKHRVFQPFDRLDRYTHVDGAGVALALAKRLVELQGGKIGFESEENVGSRFWLDLPTANN